MGLTIGICVKRQREGYGEIGKNPGGTRSEVEADIETFVREKCPGQACSLSVSVSVSERGYDFDVRLSRYDETGISTVLYLALLEYILSRFSTNHGIDAHIYSFP